MKRNRLFSDEQEQFIRDHAHGMSNKDLTQMINKHFERSLTVQQIKTWKKNHGVRSGLTGRFEKGHIPINKGTKGIYNVGGSRTSFKKGQRPLNYKPIGSERISRDGYVLVKVQDHGTWPERWRHKHNVLWEKVNGPIPKDHVLVFADQDKLNITMENLLLVTRKQLLILNRKKLIKDEPEATKVGTTIAKIYEKEYELRKEKTNV